MKINNNKKTKTKPGNNRSNSTVVC